MANNNLGFTMTIKATDGTLVPLYPQTIKSQIVGWNAGEVYGPYQLTLSANYKRKITEGLLTILIQIHLI